jgi:hypothetical protein
MGKPKGGAAMGGLERRGGGWLIGGVVLIPDLGFHQKKGHANEQGGSVCLSALLAPGPIRHPPNQRTPR